MTTPLNNHLALQKVYAALVQDRSGKDPNPGWIGYVDSRNAVHAVRLSRALMQTVGHDDQFGGMVNALPHRWRMPVELSRTVYWWESPEQDALFAVEDFFAGRGIEVAGHVSHAAQGRIASTGYKIGDPAFLVGDQRFRSRETALRVAQERGTEVIPVVFTRYMTWDKRDS